MLFLEVATILFVDIVRRSVREILAVRWALRASDDNYTFLVIVIIIGIIDIDGEISASTSNGVVIGHVI